MTSEPSRPVAQERQAIRILTARYQNRAIAEAGLLPVRITLGGPRFRLPYSHVSYTALAPRRAYFRAPLDEFRRLYREDLERLTVERILVDLHDLVQQHRSDAEGVVLLCFEDVRQDGAWCHRQLLSAWLGEHGIEAQELPEPK